MVRIYADYAAATPTDKKVALAMQPFFTNNFGNPSSNHNFGRFAADAVESSRAEIAKFINAKPKEVYFTGTGTESNNLAILGAARANKKTGNHIVTTQIEHPSVLTTCQALERDGLQVAYVAPHENGTVSPKQIASAVTAKTSLISVHLANSEIGVIQDVAAIVQAVKSKNPQTLVHVDACQATSFIEFDVQKLGVDLLAFNGSKAYGPKGIAVLYVRDKVSIFPLIYGGGQEQSLRSGTENVPGIVGLAEAVRIIKNNRQKDFIKISDLRDFLQAELKSLGNILVNCEDAPRLPNHLSVTLAKTKSTDLVRDLDAAGIAVSAGSACSSKSLAESHVLAAIGLNSQLANKTIRITLGRETTSSDCRTIIDTIKTLV
ncbi:MAG: cysteine desulfurase [Candidatus Berkelbacteria bacterium]|nr:MAG: cysteine desulfurase [Candidatus Berkelbacteria bacterium]QQG52023.1 MAG: cysteine desulfurase [Candidatus Berkelbacteria bacterium]